MTWIRVCPVVLLAGLACADSSFAQARACLHGGFETPAEATRRDEALMAMRLIGSLLVKQPPTTTASYPTWEELAQSPRLAVQRGMGGAMGDLTRKIQWGTREPLPGWGIHYLADRDHYAFSLTDLRDPCGYTYSTNEEGVILEGLPVTRRGPGIVPVT